MNRIWNIQLRSIQATRVKHNIDTPLQDPRVTFWGSVLPKVTEVAATPQIHSHARLPGLTEWQCGYAGTHTRLLAFTPQNFLDFGLFKKQIFNNISASARSELTHHHGAACRSRTHSPMTPRLLSASHSSVPAADIPLNHARCGRAPL